MKSEKSEKSKKFKNKFGMRKDYHILFLYRLFGLFQFRIIFRYFLRISNNIGQIVTFVKKFEKNIKANVFS